MRTLVLLVVLAGQATLVSAQGDFVETAREASRKYQTLEAAIAAGYRKVGPDLPNMGEHWIQPRHAVRSAVDPHRPSVLTYLRVAGVPVLTGVAYTIVVSEGQEAPPSPIAGAEWHFHSGPIEEEIAGGMHHAHSGFRLGMIHAWIWTKNPDGLFEADNWGLSYQRLGLPIPDRVAPAASKALFLLDGGVEYYDDLIRFARPLPEEVSADLQGIFTRYRDLVAIEVTGEGAPSTETLSRIWQELCLEVKGRVDEADWDHIRFLAH